jgi:hypothetical protein
MFFASSENRNAQAGLPMPRCGRRRGGNGKSHCFTNSVPSIFKILFQFHLRHRHDNFTEQVAIFHAFVGFGAFLQWQYYIDNRFQEAATQQFQRGK